MPEYNIPDDVNQMSDLDKVIEATRVTNEVFIKRGHPSGKVNVVQYLMTGNQLCFTSENGARLLASTINYQKAHLEAQTRLLRVSADYARVGTKLSDNDIINLILTQAKNNLGEVDYDINAMRSFLNNILQRYPNSDLVTVALMGKAGIKIASEDPMLEDVANRLDNYATLLDPNLEQKVVFGNKR